MKTLILTALVALLLTTQAEARDKKGVSISYSYEILDTCEKFVAGRKSESKNIQVAWLRGYMTAVNDSITGKDDFFVGIDEVCIADGIRLSGLAKGIQPHQRNGDYHSRN